MAKAIRLLGFVITLICVCSCGQNSTSSLEPGTTNESPSVQINNNFYFKKTQTTPDTIEITETSLICETIVETSWGSGLAEFGYQSDRTMPGRFPGPYSPVFNEQGEMFVADPVNNRILKYSRGENNPNIIEIPKSYVLDFGSYDEYWYNIDVYDNQIFLLFFEWNGSHNRVIQKLAILTLDGLTQQIIDLEPYYPIRSHLTRAVFSDKNGGAYVLLPPAGMVHYNDKFQPEFIYLGSEAKYEGIKVGWDGNLYTYFSRELLHNWGSAENPTISHGESKSYIKGIESTLNTESSYYLRFLGVDIQGYIYFQFIDGDSIIWVTRLNSDGERGVIGNIDYYDFFDMHFFSLAPDGSLYNIVYDSDDITVKPRIISCRLQ